MKTYTYYRVVFSNGCSSVTAPTLEAALQIRDEIGTDLIPGATEENRKYWAQVREASRIEKVTEAVEAVELVKVPKPFVLTYTSESNDKYYIGVDKKLGNRDNPYLSTDRLDAYEYEADTSKTTLLYNLEKYFNLVNLKVEEV
jgi:hypothetical protein